MVKQGKILCDTNIISSYLRNDSAIITSNINKIGVENICITPVIYIELINWLSLYKGITSKDRAIYRNRFAMFNILPLSKKIGDLSVEIALALDNSQPQDTLIGATAITNKIPLYTLNVKDFKRMKEKFTLQLY